MADPLTSNEALASTEVSNETFAAMDIVERIRYVARQWDGEVVATTSFGAQAVVLLHLLSQHAPDVPVVCVDTGYLFPETYQYAETLQRELGLEVKFYSSPMTPARMESTIGRLWELGEDQAKQYGLIRKVEPLNRAIKELGAKAWISGVRHAQSKDRAQRTFIEKQKATTKIYPILDWTDEEIADYIDTHQLPQHPLVARGFVSIGDWHSTRKLEEGMSQEDTRNHGNGRECGLHLDSNVSDFQI
ncbi:phosphoadenylyl-sulfate reductase [Sulfuriroseicoccus oceanibius]|uniref:Phosphoadenosine 5'-phosphosulfate reductase n=1 Tax=Sulfuriroseicoccus oceanibius TaxID=2707525 RepID=A0A6B3LAZ9_9BACT|nr:phosphoadenylyl-sulfate reductase [Sulfuriroseicoccus oceanibius]QQL46194.1 phosphoadenylyl-sulfate reductase [Sulfuriroseicoccus oceanibius]